MNKVNPTIITVYGADWCGDCIRAKFILDNNNIEYKYIDVDDDNEAMRFVIEVNPQKYRSIPVIVFRDGDILIEPSTQELVQKLEAGSMEK